MPSFLGKMILAEKSKLSFILFLIIIALGGWWFFLRITPSEPKYLQDKQADNQVKKWKTLKENSSYIYQTVYSQLQSEGTVLTPLEKEGTLSQIFPKSKIWKFTDKNGKPRYLVDGADKIEHNVVNNEPVTEKVVETRAIDFDYDSDGNEELIIFTLISFKDVALCCDQKKFLNIFKTEGRKKILIYEQELEIYRGGWVIKDFKSLDLNKNGEDEILEIKVYGDGYTGAYGTVLRWFIVENKQFKEIWKETLDMDMEMAGLIPEKEKENYETVFELQYKKSEFYPIIKVTRVYSKRFGKVLSSQEEEVIFYHWNKENRRFEKEE